MPSFTAPTQAPGAMGRHSSHWILWLYIKTITSCKHQLKFTEGQTLLQNSFGLWLNDCAFSKGLSIFKVAPFNRRWRKAVDKMLLMNVSLKKQLQRCSFVRGRHCHIATWKLPSFLILLRSCKNLPNSGQASLGAQKPFVFLKQYTV